MTELIVYTACIGPRSVLQEHECDDEDTDYVAFLNPQKEMESWIVMPGGLTSSPRRQQPDWPRLTARGWKALSNQVFSDHKYSLWIDGSMKLIKSPREDLEELMGDCDLVGYQHPRRNCVYEEIKTCKGDRVETFQARDDPFILEACQVKYKEEGMPKEYGLIENGFLLRRHTPALAEFNDLWMHEIAESSLEDQLVMMYCLWKTGLKWKALEGNATDNEYIEWVGHVGTR